MKNYLLLLITCLGLASCNVKKDMMPQALGSDRDENGCISSAGQTWSTLKQSCIQVFNEGVRLNPVKTKADEAIISAFLLFNDDKSKLELFLPDNKETFIMKEAPKNVYKSKKYVYNSEEGILYINNVKEYSK